MKKTFRYLFILFIAIGSVSSYSGCKKGQDDPAVSFRSRKARVVGNWKVEKFHAKTHNATSSGTLTCDYSFVNNKFSSDCDTQNPSYNDVWAYTFSKDGSLKITEDIVYDDGETMNITTVGRWNFLAGVGKVKNKEVLILNISTIDYTLSSKLASVPVHYFQNSKDATVAQYKLTELSNKEIHWEFDNIYSDATGYFDEQQGSAVLVR